MGKQSPAAPDYAGAAQAQANSSREVTEQQTWANRPTMNTPFGQQSWAVTPTWDPTTGQYINQWTQNTNLTPESQAALDSQMRLQAGRSGLAESLLNRAQTEYGDTMDWSRFSPLAQGPKANDYDPSSLTPFSGVPNVPNYDTSRLPTRGDYGGALPNRGRELSGSDYDAILAGLPQRGTGPNQETYSPEQIQRSLDTAGLQNVDPSQRYNQDAENAIYGQWENRMGPEFERQSESLRTQLYNTGLREGDEAYDREMEKMRQTQGDARTMAQYQATIGAGEEAARMHGMDLSTRGQQFGERTGMGTFTNTAAQQALEQQLGIGGQRFGEGMSLADLRDRQRADAMGEQFGAAGAGFGQQQAISGQSDAQRQAAFEEMMSLGGASDAQRQAALAEMMGIGSQQYQQEMAGAQLQDTRRQQMGQEQLAFGQNRFAEQMQASNYQNQLRQQQIAEEMQRRGFSLNEINAILSGQQVSMPNMPGFNAASRPEGLQALNAAQMQGQHDLDVFNAQQQQMQGLMSGVGGAMMFSDRRLKTNIKPVFKFKGLQVYSYDLPWGKDIGVMSDEVPREFVAVHPSGYEMVNYGLLIN